MYYAYRIERHRASDCEWPTKTSESYAAADCSSDSAAYERCGQKTSEKRLGTASGKEASVTFPAGVYGATERHRPNIPASKRPEIKLDAAKSSCVVLCDEFISWFVFALNKGPLNLHTLIVYL